MLTSFADQIFLAINALVGRSWFVDTAFGLVLRNELLKAAVIGGCVMAAWHGRATADEVLRRRRMLLLGVLAAAFAITASKAIAPFCATPRPFVRSSVLFVHRNDQLFEHHRLPFRVPLEYASEQRHKALLDGEVRTNDCLSFPSDHAALYISVALGVWWASRTWGFVALGWTLLVVLASKVIHGMHSPLDIAAGAALAGIAFAICLAVDATSLRKSFDQFIRLFDRYPAVGSGALFIVLFEITCTLAHVEELLSAVLRHLPRS